MTGAESSPPISREERLKFMLMVGLGTLGSLVLGAIAFAIAGGSP